MIVTHKFFRAFAAQEVVALLEKVDATGSTGDSSYHAAKRLLNDGAFNFFERKLLRSALRKVSRRETLIGAMNIVVFNNVEGQNRLASPMNEADTYNPARGCVISPSPYAQQAWANLVGQQDQQATIKRNYFTAGPL